MHNIISVSVFPLFPSLFLSFSSFFLSLPVSPSPSPVYFSQTFRFAKVLASVSLGETSVSPPTILGQQFSNLERACARLPANGSAFPVSHESHESAFSRGENKRARVYFCRYANSTPPRTSRQPTEVLFWTLIECYACLSDDSRVEAELHMAFVRKQHKVIRKFQL